MTTLATGASATFAVRDGGAVSVATNGGFGAVTVTRTGGAAVTCSFGPGPVRRVFGPYAEGASVTVSNESCAEFDYDAQQQAAPQLLAATAVAASVTGTTSETVLATVSIPPGAMGLTGAIEVRTIWSGTASANNKTYRVRLGGASGSQVLSIVLTTTPNLSDVRRLRNRNSASSQLCSAGGGGPVGGFGSTDSSIVATSINTAVAQDLVISAQLAISSETATLEGYEVWLLP